MLKKSDDIGHHFAHIQALYILNAQEYDAPIFLG
jgi:hypothetical protein